MEIPRPSGYLLSDIFPNFIIDLSLRLREPKSDIEKRQKKAIFAVDQWCSEYENRIQELGGIGFFLGGIGPDGHIAFNVRGSDHNSTTRILETTSKPRLHPLQIWVVLRYPATDWPSLLVYPPLPEILT
jgi:glucosamine-6-phosphate deaminase